MDTPSIPLPRGAAKQPLAGPSAAALYASMRENIAANRDAPASDWAPGLARDILALAKASKEDGAADCADHPFEFCVFAAMQRREDVLLILLDAGFSPDPIMADTPYEIQLEWTRLFFHCASFNLPNAIERLSPLAPIHATRSPFGTTALMAAVNGKSDDAFFLLLRLGADPHVRMDNGCLCIMNAAANDNPVIIAELLRLGADPYAQDNRGLDASAYARRRGALHFPALLEAQELSRCVAPAQKSKPGKTL